MTMPFSSERTGAMTEADRDERDLREVGARTDRASGHLRRAWEALRGKKDAPEAEPSRERAEHDDDGDITINIDR
jgi:hypothetical protein